MIKIIGVSIFDLYFKKEQTTISVGPTLSVNEWRVCGKAVLSTIITISSKLTITVCKSNICQL
jgi:hypothetical protein